MKTRCQNCQTTFRVTPEQLKARAGKVRCGQCQTVFNALDNLVDETGAPPVSSLPALDPSPVAQSAEIAALPLPAEQDYSAETVETVPAPSIEAPVSDEPHTDQASTTPSTDHAIDILLEPTQTEPERIEPALASGQTPADEETQTLSEAEVQAIGKATGLILPREMTEVPGYSKWTAGVMAAPLHHDTPSPVRWPYAIVAIILSLALTIQLAFRFRSELAISVPLARPALEALSQALGANIPLPRHANLVSIEASDLQSDAARGNVLVLSATLRNRAAYPQAFPALELALTDTHDTPIARRIFLPDEYLSGKTRESAAFGANSDIPVRLWVEAKDINAAGYRLYVFYP